MNQTERVTSRGPADATQEPVPESILRAESCFQQNDFKGAAAHFLSAIKAHPKNARAWNGMGVCFHRMGELNGAITAFRKAMEYNPDDPAGMANLNQVLWEQGQHTEAIKLARSLLAKFPELDVLREQLRAAGVERSDQPEILLIASTDAEQRLRTLLQTHMTKHIVRSVNPKVTALLSTEEDHFDAQILSAICTSAQPAFLAIPANTPNLHALLQYTTETGQRTIVFDAAPETELPESAVRVSTEESESAAQIFRVLDAEPAASRRPVSASPHISLVVQTQGSQDLVEHLDRIALQGIHPALYEVLLISEKPKQVDRSLQHIDLPFTHRVVRDHEEARRYSSGKLCAPAPFETLAQQGAVIELLKEAKAACAIGAHKTLLTAQSTARTCALVKGSENEDHAMTTLRALRAHHGPEELRIIYLHHSATAPPVLHEAFPAVEVVSIPERQSDSRAINTGLMLAAMERHEFVLLLDGGSAPPIEDRDWLKRWISAFKHPNVGIAGAVSETVTGRQHIEHCPETYMRSFTREQGTSGTRGRPSIPYALSFAVLIRSTALASVGWLVDETLANTACEDADLSLRVREHGWDVVVAQSVWIHQPKDPTFAYQCSDDHLGAHVGKLTQKYGTGRLGRLGIKVTS